VSWQCGLLNDKSSAYGYRSRCRLLDTRRSGAGTSVYLFAATGSSREMTLWVKSVVSDPCGNVRFAPQSARNRVAGK
jgi:hypothetical protein